MPDHHTLYTMGYTGSSTAKIIEAARGAGKNNQPAVIVDIRFSPRSRVNEWDGMTLRSRLDASGIEYRHLPDLGNMNFKSAGPITLKNERNGVHELLGLLEKQNCIILCACQWLDECHRKTVAELIAQAGVPIIHIGGQRKDENKADGQRLLF